MLLETLKNNLSAEVYAQVETELKDKEIKLVPYERFSKVTEAKNTAEAKVSELEKQIEGFADYEELKTKYAETEEKLKGFADYEELKAKNVELINDGRKAKIKLAGIDESFVDYVLTVVDDENFDESLSNFIDKNPKFKTESFVPQQSQFNLDPAGKVDFNSVKDDKEYIQLRKEYNLDGTKK